MRIEVHVSTNRVGSRNSVIIEVDNDLSANELREAALDAMFEHLIEWGYKLTEEE